MLIQKHIALRRTRKSLLADLSSLIKCRNQIQDTFSGQNFDEVSWATIDDYMGKAFRVACRSVRFLDLWLQGAALQPIRAMSSFDEQIEPTLPSSTTASFSPTSPAHLRTQLEDEAQPGASPTEETLDIDTRRKSRSSRDSRSSRPNSAGGDGLTKRLSSLYPREIDTRFTPRSSLSRRTSSPLLGLQPEYSSGLGVHVEELSNSDLASERLSAAHDHLLGHIGAFLGLHLQSRTSLDLASATERSLEACTGLIAVTKEIWMNDAHRSPQLSHAMMGLRRNLGVLADAAQELCEASHPFEDPALLKPEQGKGLVKAATACVRSAGECTAKARQTLDQNGDFTMDMDNVYRHQQANKTWHDEEDNNESQLRAVNANPREVVIIEDEEITGQALEERDPIFSKQAYVRSNTMDVKRLTRFSFSSDSGTRPASLPESFIIEPDTSFIAPPTPTSLCPPATPGSTLKSVWTTPTRKESVGLSAAASTSTYQTSLRYSTGSVMSPTSTRATTPDRACPSLQPGPTLLNSFSSISSMRSAGTGASDGSECDADILAKSYAHELLFNKEGQILGGTLRALVEKLTSQHSPPDPIFVNAFYLTFRLFTNSVDLANALIDRFQYVGESRTESMPARLRIYNFLKGWLESHFLSEFDSEALGLIQTFATEKLQPVLSAPGFRLAELADKASQQTITNTATQLVSPIGKTSISLGTQYEKDSVPSAIINKSQISLLRLVHVNMSRASVTDFDALEIARQLTLIQSRTFCAIEAEELLNLNWTKNAQDAVNVRDMARFATDLANLVADTILSVEETKKRAVVVRQWIKIGKCCLDLNNYDSLMAVVCSLTSSTILRLRATWDQVPQKVKTQFDELKGTVDVSRNYAILRSKLQSPTAPCLPFVGIYLTDLTFIDAGNQDTRVLPRSDDTTQPVNVINFDKHMRTTKIISDLQRYQVPYRLQPVLPLQTWIETQTARVRGSEDCCMQSFWRRSLKLEPKAPEGEIDRPGTSNGFRLGHKVSKSGLNGVFSREKYEFLSTLGFKSESELKAKIAAG